jgi:hypothetical protein
MQHLLDLLRLKILFYHNFFCFNSDFNGSRTYDLVAARRTFLHCLFICFGVMLPYPLFAWLYVLLLLEARWRESGIILVPGILSLK